MRLYDVYWRAERFTHRHDQRLSCQIRRAIMQHRSIVATAAALILAMVMQALSVSTARSSEDTIPIAEARHQPLGTEVTVKGSVTVPSGTFNSFTFDQGFAIQDRTGGIYVSVLTDLHLRLHRRVRVTGTLQDSFGLLILVPEDVEDVEVLPDWKRVEPQEVSTCDISERTEGRLVRVVGTVTRPSELDQDPVTGHIFGYRVFIDSDPHHSCADGSSGELEVFIAVGAGINPLEPPFSEIIAVDNQIEVTGFSGEFTTDPANPHYEVNPRRPRDIQQAE
jgi:hypothetical protein